MPSISIKVKSEGNFCHPDMIHGAFSPERRFCLDSQSIQVLPNLLSHLSWNLRCGHTNMARNLILDAPEVNFGIKVIFHLTSNSLWGIDPFRAGEDEIASQLSSLVSASSKLIKVLMCDHLTTFVSTNVCPRWASVSLGCILMHAGKVWPQPTIILHLLFMHLPVGHPPSSDLQSLINWWCLQYPID